MVTDVKYERITFRSFDRQWVIADSRLLDRPRRPLWEARHPGQIFVVEQHSIHPRQGPALYFSGSMPDINAFNNRGGRTLPMLHPDGSPNLVSGLLEVLVTHFGAGIDPTDLVYYLAGVTAHPGFVETFDDELTTPGIRVPMTADRALWDRAVQLGKHAVWLHSFGTAGGHPDGIHDIRSPQILIAHPSYNVPVGKRMPTSLQYDADAQELRLGNGVWAPVSAEVRNYTVGGVKVIDSWVGYRMEKPKGRRSSPLDDINVTQWPSEWSAELSELLSVLAQLVALEPSQLDLLEDILAGPLFTVEALTEAGVQWPTSSADRNPRRVVRGGLFG
ncbi:hypothetical protein F8M49_01095 [Rhodococcus zopfii]|uniref:Type ISP restriction-modification enzyme LLaBIII C-terminal specificity domain-containing protein n=1 Tax=Rhodococcus zopfii TaxID=43772 RepID=A0ABU3WK83_9NOCA|nr:hypothetical protein [Rhodococcus zopfii]